MCLFEKIGLHMPAPSKGGGPKSGKHPGAFVEKLTHSATGAAAPESDGVQAVCFMRTIFGIYFRECSLACVVLVHSQHEASSCLFRWFSYVDLRKIKSQR